MAAKGGDQCLEEAEKGQVGDADKPCLSWLRPFTNELVCPRNRVQGGAGTRACRVGRVCVGGVRSGKSGEKQELDKERPAMCKAKRQVRISRNAAQPPNQRKRVLNGQAMELSISYRGWDGIIERER